MRLILKTADLLTPNFKIRLSRKLLKGKKASKDQIAVA
jgi:hypothetical protein